MVGILLTSRDVGERKAFEAKLAHQAFHDAVTGLPNRALFRERVVQSLAEERRGHAGGDRGRVAEQRVQPGDLP